MYVMDMDMEGPGPEDLRRFSGETAHCPHCGAPVWDEAGICPDCGAILGGDTVSRPPLQRRLRRRWLLVVVLVALAALLIGVIGW